ncbi:MAG: ABC transporter ATP-binding protein [Fimbriimonadales bacterium]|nr:ABC transporter ATP-binding protein [Fimbriimonadales bacterium]
MSDLVVRGLVKAYEARRVLDGLSFELRSEESMAVLGPSGSGKTTLLNLVGTLDKPDEGAIELDGSDVSQLSDPEAEAFRRDRVGFVFQDHLLLPELTGFQNVLLPALGRCTPEILDRADSLIRTLGISHRSDAHPWQMSGGERQRFALARALLNHPTLLLCDEPTGNLDAATGEAVVSLLLDLAREHGSMLLLATHNQAHARRCLHRYRLQGGRLEPVG